MIKKSNSQRIETKVLWLGSKGKRVKASSASGLRVEVIWDEALDEFHNHAKACDALLKKLEWRGDWIGVNKWDGSGFTFLCDDSPLLIANV